MHNMRMLCSGGTMCGISQGFKGSRVNCTDYDCLRSTCVSSCTLVYASSLHVIYKNPGVWFSLPFVLDFGSDFEAMWSEKMVFRFSNLIHSGSGSNSFNFFKHFLEFPELCQIEVFLALSSYLTTYQMLNLQFYLLEFLIFDLILPV